MAQRCFSLIMLWSLSYLDHCLYQLEYSLCCPEHVIPLGLAKLPIVKLQVVEPPLIAIQSFKVMFMLMPVRGLAPSHLKHRTMKLSWLNSILVFMLDHHLSKF